MEIHSLHKVTKGLGLKGSEAWIANFPAEKISCLSVFYGNYLYPVAG